jgi:hypothetical protein
MSPSDRPKPPNTAKAPDLPHPDEPPSEEELRAAGTLRDALESEGAREGIAELAQSIRAVAAPQALLSERHREILNQALGGTAPRERTLQPVVATRSRASKVAYLAVGGAAGVLAIAAAVALVIRGAAPDREVASRASAARARSVMAFSRSTAELFPEGIPRSGGTTDRVDRIAYARAQDFRQNQFARWAAP